MFYIFGLAAAVFLLLVYSFTEESQAQHRQQPDNTVPAVKFDYEKYLPKEEKKNN